MTSHSLFSRKESDQGARRRRVTLPGNGQARLLMVVLALAVMALAGCGSGAGSPSSTTGQPAGTPTEFPLPESALIPAAITAGPDGALWFTDPCISPDEASDCSGSQIGRITPAGKVTEFALPTTGQPGGIATGPDGNLWFTVSRVDATSMIDRITPGGDFSQFPLPRLLVYPYEITTGPDGNLWFTEKYGNKIGRMSPSGHLDEFLLQTSGSGPQGITAGSDGNLWFTEAGRSQIGRITPGGQIMEFALPTPGSSANEIAAGPDGNLWFTEDSGKIGRMTLGGQIKEFALSRAMSHPGGITAGPDGNVWFTACVPNEAASGGCIHNEIGRITPGGQITDFPLPVGTVPVSITAGPDKNLWFTENNSSSIGRITSGK